MDQQLLNISGHEKRKPTDNQVVKSGGVVEYESNIIDYDSHSSSWVLNSKKVGSLSNLSKALGLNKETHDIGFYLEEKGYVFKKPFK